MAGGIMTWDEARRQFPCTRGQAFLNTGTLGPVPDSVMRPYVASLTAWNAAGPGDPATYIGWRDRIEATREALGAWFSAPSTTLSFAGNVTDALNIALMGLRLPPGGRVITSDQEHGALIAPLALLAERGVTVEIIPYGHGGDDLLGRLATALERPADLVALSHVSCETGAFVDGQSLAALCHSRGALLLLYGAQTAGQISVDLTKLGADLYAFNGHKWMLAPVGCAVLYVRPDIQDRVAPTFTGDGPGWSTNYPAGVESRRPADGTRFEYGTRNWPAFVAWREVLDFWSRLPAEAAYRRQRELATVLAARLQDIDGVELWSPHLPVGGIVTVSVAGYTASELFERLRDRKVIGRRVQKGAIQGVRLCTTFFNNLDDIGQAVDAVRALATLTSRASP